MNNVTLMGRLTADPEVRYSTGATQMAIARYTLAVDRRGKSSNGERATDFINIVAFNKSGEFAEKYFHKGMRVAVRGHIQTGSYTNKNGQKVYTFEVVVDDQEFADSKGAAASSGKPAETQAADDYVGDGFMNIPDGVEDDGLPFN